MVDFRETVKIKIETDYDPDGSITTAASELESLDDAVQGLDGTLQDDLENIDDSLEDFDENVKIEAEADTDQITTEVAYAREVAALEMQSLGSVDVKIGGDFDRSVLETLADEEDRFGGIAELGEKAAEGKKAVTEANKETGDAAIESGEKIDLERESFESLVDEGDTLTQAKNKVSDANERLQNESGKSNNEIMQERAAAQGLDVQLKDLKETKDEDAESSNKLSRAVRKMRRSTDEASDSMRAASQVGELFEDGLGSLSVNMGAFTIALRNFLTQVPLLLTAIGALGAAALGAAAAIGTLGAAMLALPAVALLQEARRLKEEFQSVANLGDSLRVIMSELKDVMFTAIEPITQATSEFSFFRDAVQAVAFVVNLFSDTLASLIDPGDEVAQSVRAAGEEFNTFQDLMGMIDGSSLVELMDDLTVAFLLLGDEVISVMASMTEGFGDAITRSANLLSHVEDFGPAVSQFSDTLSELAELGFKIGGGLLPVFKAFSSIVESVASALNEVESEFAQNAITALLLFSAINKVSGVMSSFLTIGPNMVIALRKIVVAGNNASGAMATFRAAVLASSTAIGDFLLQSSLLSGMTGLITTLFSTETRFREIAFKSDNASRAFSLLAQNTDQTQEELQELAISGTLTEDMLEEVGDEADDAAQDLRNLMFQGELTGETLEDSLDDIDTRMGPGGSGGSGPSPEVFLPGTMSNPLGGAGDTMDEAVQDAGKSIKSIRPTQGMGESKKALKGLDDASTSTATGFARLKKRIVPTRKNLKIFGRSALTAGSQLVKLSLSMAALIPQLALQAGAALTAAAATFLKADADKSVVEAMRAQIAVQDLFLVKQLKTIATKLTAAAANYGLSTSLGVATASTYGLITAITIATGGLFLLVGAVGALAVGLVGNFDEIKKSAGGAFGTIKDVIDILIDVTLTYFVTIWNLLVDTVNALLQGLSPLTDMVTDLTGQFFGLASSGEESGGMMGMLSSAAEVTKDVISAAGDVVGGFINYLGGVLTIITTVIRIALTPLIGAISLLISSVEALLDWWTFLINAFAKSDVGKAMSGIFEGFIDFVSGLPKMIEEIANDAIKIVNDMLKSVNKNVPGVNLGQIEQVSLTGEQGADVSREELAKDSKGMNGGTEPEGDKTITYNEDNSTNIDQTIDADPEDQAQLSRVVTDAINEANSFERRRQGAQ